MDYATECRAFTWDVPASYNIPSVIEAHAERVGDRVAIRFLDVGGAREERTYDELRADMHRIASGLADLGVSKGDRVMHLFPRHPDAFAIQLGILATGALVVPCSSMLRPKDIAFRANDCGASAVVVHESLTDMVEPVLAATPLEQVVVLDGTTDKLPDEWTTVDAVREGETTDSDDPDLGASDPMTINYTSGTTGQPKPVLHKHRWMYCFNRINAPYWWGIDEDTDLDSEVLWATTGTGWAKWFWSPVGVGLTTGATQLVYEGAFEPERFLEVMAAERVTRFCAVPTQYRMFATTDLSYDLAVTDFLSTGEPLNREPIERFEEAFGVTPRGGYGQTETVALVANYPGIDVQPGSMGKPLPGTGTAIIEVDEETAVETGEIGEIALPVGTPIIFDGYFEKPAFDEEIFSGEYYRTGDLASRDQDGYFFFEGRADDIILSAGYRIGPFEIEDALVGHDAIAEAAAVASPHEERGSVVKAYVVLAEGYEGSETLKTEIQAFAKAETAPYKYPRRIEFVDDLPKTSSGKIRRIRLREREREEHD